jgi:exodeoxyribonuclease V alpha subunit
VTPLWEDTLARLSILRNADYFSAFDLHFGLFLTRLDGTHCPELLIAACVVSRGTRSGQVCIDLKTLAGRAIAPLDGAPSAPAVHSWEERLRRSPVVGRPGEFSPLILDEVGRLYLHRYWAYEREVASALRERAQAGSRDVDRERLRSGLARLFATAPMGETNGQKLAAAVSVLRPFSIVSGGPGTGKTSTVLKILALLLEQPSPPARIGLAAPTGKAAARLGESLRAAAQTLALTPLVKAALPTQASTLHRLLGAKADSVYFRHDRDNPLALDVLIVDEASMVDLALMAKLLRALPRSARLILLGDKDQLASVEAGAVLGDICACAGGYSSEFRETLMTVTGERVPAAAGDPAALPVSPLKRFKP